MCLILGSLDLHQLVAFNNTSRPSRCLRLSPSTSKTYNTPNQPDAFNKTSDHQPNPVNAPSSTSQGLLTPLPSPARHF